MTHFITAKQAKKLGYVEAYLTFGGLGDSLLLMHAAELYYQKYGEKLLLITNHPVFFENDDVAYVLSDADYRKITKRENYRDSIIKINGVKFHLNFLGANGFRPYRNTKELVMTWPKTHLIARLCECIGMDGDVTIDPRLTLTAAEKKFGRFFDKNQITIIGNGVMEYKTWDFDKIQEVVDRLKDQYNFVQLGKSDDRLLNGVLDKRGNLSLRQVASVLYNSDLFVGGIGGLMHLSRFVGTPGVIAYSMGEPLTLASYPCNANVVTDTPCMVCANNELDPQREVCPFGYKCVRNIPADKMIRAVEKAMRSPRPKKLETQTVRLKPDKTPGMRDFMLWHKTHCDIGTGVEKTAVKTVELFGLPLFAIHQKGNRKRIKLFPKKKK